ncbi:MAG: TraM recognition domain-containing protein [Saprospiraceae bacterium]|nr:TraM recognition domain-containing protein [Saprospiraceae bacterium]
MNYISDLDAPLHTFEVAKPGVKLSEEDRKKNEWTLRDAVRGVQIFGGIGSGKSSGSGRTLALKYLNAGFGGIVLCGKVDERETWERYFKESRRPYSDLVVFSPDTNMYPQYRFNPLEYEQLRSGVGGGNTRNIINLFTSLAKLGGRAHGESVSDSGFWERAMRRCIQSVVNLLDLAGEAITVPEIARVIQYTPLTGTPLADYKKMNLRELEAWGSQNPTIAYLNQAYRLLAQSSDAAKEQTLDVVTHYLLSEFSSLAPETRSSILEHFYALADPFRSGLLAKHFSGQSSREILPERTFEGKVIVLDFSVKEHLDSGIYAQAMYQRIWQQAVERRPVNATTRPVFMWVDESQYFVSQELVMFQTTARSARALTVLLTQSVSNYYAALGGKKELVHSLLGNLATKIFHNQQDPETNELAANTIGKTYVPKATTTDKSVSLGEELQYQYLPMNFTMLRTGGGHNENIVDAAIMTAGKRWSNGKNFMITRFEQP